MPGFDSPGGRSGTLARVPLGWTRAGWSAPARKIVRQEPRKAVGAACFLEGTRIATESGPKLVEKLAADDKVVTLISGASAAVRWVAVRTVDCRRHPEPGAAWPIRIAAHAFGPCEPMRTLLVSPGHAVWLDGVMVPVRALVNGRTILQVRMDRVRYYHVELERDEAVLAEGLAVESHRAPDVGVVSLFPDFARRSDYVETVEVRQRLVERAEMLLGVVGLIQ